MKKLLNKMLIKRAKALHDQFEKALPAEGKILDIGSGTGHTGDEILRTTQLEIAEVDIADLSMNDRQPIIYDGAKLPFADNSFDLALAIHILQYTPSATSLIKEGLRVADKLVIVNIASPRGMSRIPVFLYDWFGGRLFFYIFRALGIAPKGPNNMVARRQYSEQDIRQSIPEAGGLLMHHNRTGFAPRHHTFVIERMPVQQPKRQGQSQASPQFA